ncbi:hypothetical protein BJF79_20495 [Actinomadura sp. CNU-125]|nr:hypothetical protein BJF79_20495 [Actinomadura sp. CNU-125]
MVVDFEDLHVDEPDRRLLVVGEVRGVGGQFDVEFGAGFREVAEGGDDEPGEGLVAALGQPVVDGPLDLVDVDAPGMIQASPSRTIAGSSAAVSCSSVISPTSSSARSSRVRMPVKPPNSSMTQASSARSSARWLRAAGSGMRVGTTVTGRMIVDTGAVPRSAASTSSRCTTPITRSSSSSTG